MVANVKVFIDAVDPPSAAKNPVEVLSMVNVSEPGGPPLKKVIAVFVITSDPAPLKVPLILAAPEIPGNTRQAAIATPALIILVDIDFIF